jgi:TetR/AcrR family transcriptional repressor of nem operon
MARPSHREKILAEGRRVVQEQGFAGASVRDIVAAAGVPQGSFTNHFASKEAFCLEVLDLYFADTHAMIGRTLRNDGLPPLRRLAAYVDAMHKYLKRTGLRNGCLIGNFSAEASDHSEIIRKRIVDIFAETQDAMAYCLRAAIKAGELPPKTDCDELAGFVIASHQGAILRSKAERSSLPLDRFKRFLFSTILR